MNSMYLSEVSVEKPNQAAPPVVASVVEASGLAATSAESNECRVAIVGFGTVGSAVARLLTARSGEHRLRLAQVCNRDVGQKKVDWVHNDVVWTESMRQVLESDADVVVELIGGLEPARELVSSALRAKKSVVTANKQLIAYFGSELLKLAEDNGQSLGFGACVAGGVPVLSALQDGLAGDRLVKLQGILNGTCNYILSRIERSGSSFADALREAQEAGFAEVDPSFDIDGQDAGAKLAILARVGLKIEVPPDKVVCRTVRDISAIDFEYARDLGCTIRQVSIAKHNANDNGKAYVAVQPALIASESPLAKVSGSQNLLVSTGEFGGETSFGGQGAGGDATAVAVVSDLLQAASHRQNNKPTGSIAAEHCEITGDLEARQYLRLVVKDRSGILATLGAILAKRGMNLDAVLQKPGHPKSVLPFVITLELCRQSQLDAALEEIKGCDFLVEAPLAMPILD